MTKHDLPQGIDSHTLKGGKQRYEARVNRGQQEFNKRFKTLGEAVAWRTQVVALLDAGIDPWSVLPRKKPKHVSTTQPSEPRSSNAASLEGESPLTVRQAVQNYLTHKEGSLSPVPSNRATDYTRVSDDWDDTPVSELRNEDLCNYMFVLRNTPLKRDAKKQAAGTLVGKPRTFREATIRKFVFALKLALKWNEKNGRVTLRPHLFDFDRGTMPSAWANPRDRRLKPGEEELLCTSAARRGDYTYSGGDWRAIIGFALETALREQEITMARWRDLSQCGEKLLVPAPHSKTRKARTILLSMRARAIVEEQRKSAGESERIFHQVPNAQALCEAFASLRERAGIDGLHFHDLRHEATSRICEAGKLPLMAIMEMTGHKSMVTFGGYVHLIAQGSKVSLD